VCACVCVCVCVCVRERERESVCGNGALCSVVEDDLFFSLSFIYFDLRIYFSLVFI